MMVNVRASVFSGQNSSWKQRAISITSFSGGKSSTIRLGSSSHVSISLYLLLLLLEPPRLTSEGAWPNGSTELMRLLEQCFPPDHKDISSNCRLAIRHFCANMEHLGQCSNGKISQPKRPMIGSWRTHNRTPGTRFQIYIYSPVSRYRLSRGKLNSF